MHCYESVTLCKVRRLLQLEQHNIFPRVSGEMWLLWLRTSDFTVLLNWCAAFLSVSPKFAWTSLFQGLQEAAG